MGALVDSTSKKRGLPGIAHEFANLMQVVNGNLELLDAHVTDPVASRYLANARAAAGQLTELSRALTAKASER